MTGTARFGYLPVASELLSEEAPNRLIADYIPAFKDLGGERWSSGTALFPGRHRRYRTGDP